MKEETTTKEAMEDPWWMHAHSMARVLSDSERIRDNDVQPLLELRDRLVGPHFGGGVGDPMRDRTKNNTFGYFKKTHAEVLGGTLQCVIDTDPGSPEEGIQLAYERAINVAFDRGRGPEMVELAFADMACGYGGLFVEPAPASTIRLRSYERASLHHPVGVLPWASKDSDDRSALPTEPQPQVDAEPFHPRIHYLPPNTWGWDRRAFTMSEAEFFWYESTHDILELIQRAKDEGSSWRLEALRGVRDKINSSSSQKKVGGQRGANTASDMERQRVTLKTVIVNTAKVPDKERPKGCHSVAYVMWCPDGASEAAIYVKDPCWNFAPPFGQFALFSEFMVGEDSTPFGTLIANKTKIIANDEIHAIAHRRIKDMKRNPVFDAAQKGNIDRLEKAADGEPVAIHGGAGGLTYFDVVRGGLDAPFITALEYDDIQIAEDLGLSANARGAIEGGDNTATEATIANQASAAAASQFKKSFNRGLSQLYRIIGWYVGHDARFVVRADFAARAAFHEQEGRKMRDTAREAAEAGLDDGGYSRLSDNDMRQLGQRAARRSGGQQVFQGGDFSELEDYDFDEFRFRVNAHQQRASTMFESRIESAQLRQDLAQILQLAVQMPFYDWTSELRQLEEDYGRRGLVARFDEDKASLMAQVQIEGGTVEAAMDPSSTSASLRGSNGPRVTVQSGGVGGRRAAMQQGAAQGGIPNGTQRQ